MLLSTDRRVLTNIRDSNKGYTFKELCDLSGIQAGDITKSLQYLSGKDLIESIERPEGRVFLITETDTQELNGNAEPEDFKCQYCGKPYSAQGWLDKHESKCKKRPEAKELVFDRTKKVFRPYDPAKRTFIEPAQAEVPVMPQAQTVRCNGCGSLHKIKRKYGAELLECPLCLKA